MRQIENHLYIEYTFVLNAHIHMIPFNWDTDFSSTSNCCQLVSHTLFYQYMFNIPIIVYSILFNTIRITPIEHE